MAWNLRPVLDRGRADCRAHRFGGVRVADLTIQGSGGIVETSESVGYLDYSMFNRLGWAVHHSAEIVPWLRVAGYIRGGDNLRIQTSSSHPLGLPPTWLAAEEISRLLGELNRWPELEDAANDEWGAELCVLLVREVETARRKWPLEDRPHQVQFIRCPRCRTLSLRYSPPRFEGDRIVVRCFVDGTDLDEDGFSYQAKLVEEENARRLGDCGGGSGTGGSVETDDLPVGA